MTKKMIRVRVGTPRKNKSSIGYLPPIEIVDQCRMELDYNGAHLDDILDQLTEFKTKYGGEYQDLGLESSWDCGCRYNCNCLPAFYLTGTRLESDVEYDYRIALEKKRSEEEHKKDIRELKRLQSKLKIKE